ncbi:MAG TPA: hypothetical protein GXX75_22125 [Clostridiales bacterium]|nr:hypothetical protein [Clostridiales bacterium]
MEYKDIDEILKSSLSPAETPPAELNHRVLAKMQEKQPRGWRNRGRLAVACAIICALLIPTSIYAAGRLLSPKEAAFEAGDDKLGDAFEKTGEGVYQTITDGAYKATYLGYVNGAALSERIGSAHELNPERTYVAVAIERTDGTEIQYTDNLFVSPLIQGLQPWKYNIASMHGGYVSSLVDGVLYRIIECDSIEMFSNKQLYLIVSDTSFYSVDAYQYDEATGLITVNPAYPGTNILFPIELDPSKADAEKAAAYISRFEEEWNKPAEGTSAENTQPDKAADGATGEAADPIPRETLYTDEKNGIQISIKNDDLNGWYNGWWSDDSSSGTTFSYHFAVEGDNVESLTYSLNKGQFCYWPKAADPALRKFYGNKYTVAYDEQEGIDYHYSINVDALASDYGYDEAYLKNPMNQDEDAFHQLLYDILEKEIESMVAKLEIKMKDGSILEKELSFNNLIDEGAFLVEISLK